MCSKEIKILIGNKFKEFAAGKAHVVTVSQLKSLLVASDSTLLIILGQGVSYQDATELLQTGCISTKNHELNELAYTAPSNKNTNTHKVHSENVVIGHAISLGNHVFEFLLLIDENCEMLQDHQTGQHIQGILIIEAFRQTIVAVTNEYLAKQYFPAPSLIVSNVHVSYDDYVFPLPSKIIFRLKELDNSNSRRLNVVAQLELWQCNAIRAHAEFTYSIYPKDFISKIENLAARKITQYFLNNLNNYPDKKLLCR